MISAERIADLAVNSLLAELELYPKPGLVSPMDSGSHRDMDYALLQASARCLHPSFRELAEAGKAGAGFSATLVPLGIKAERQMLQVTRGVNTHRGAIFSTGLLAAAAGARRGAVTPNELPADLLSRWGGELELHAQRGLHPAGMAGAREEAARGFPSVFQLALPHLQTRLREGVPFAAAGIETLFVLIATIADTNVNHRGGADGVHFARQRAQAFLDAGGVTVPDWFERAVQIHHEFIQRNLSPGGAADLLAATFFVHSLDLEVRVENPRDS